LPVHLSPYQSAAYGAATESIAKYPTDIIPECHSAQVLSVQVPMLHTLHFYRPTSRQHMEQNPTDITPQCHSAQVLSVQVPCLHTLCQVCFI
jgi:hypothetical protein